MGTDTENNPEDALLYSLQRQDKASKEGFDWDHVDGVLEKVAEELGEIQAALAEGDALHARKELGDLLLITVNLARFLAADPRLELLEATRRFDTRFECLKNAVEKDGRTIKNCAVDELESFWQRIKPVADELLTKRA